SAKRALDERDAVLAPEQLLAVDDPRGRAEDARVDRALGRVDELLLHRRRLRARERLVGALADQIAQDALVGDVAVLRPVRGERPLAERRAPLLRQREVRAQRLQ